jgi:hypothetical protein
MLPTMTPTSHRRGAVLACLLAASAASAASTAPSLATAKPGVWEDVTPAGINLSQDFPSKANGYGVMDVLADPMHPGTFYAFVCYLGCWKSQDWGTTWTKVSSDGHLEPGRPWGEAIAPDGSYMLASDGYNPHGDGGAWKSTDGGVTWVSHSMYSGGEDDPYSIDIDPANAQHAIASTHSTEIIYESKDGGQTWSSRGSCHAGHSNYVFFLTSTTWLAVGGWGDGPGTWRSTDSGTTWTRVSPSERYRGNIPMEHFHGNEQIFVDPISHGIYVPSETGIYLSTDGGQSFTQVSPLGTSSVFATATTLYAQYAWALNSAPVPTTLLSSPRSSGTSWTPMSGAAPAAMTNGVKRATPVYDKAIKAWVIISGNWTAGIWRFVEKQ